MPIKLSQRVFGTPVAKYIRDKFLELETIGEASPNGEVNPTSQNYLGDRTPFVRMWSPLLIKSSTGQEIVYHTVNDNRNLDYSPNETLTGNIVNELNDNKYLNPKAGITSISSKTEGSLGSIRRTEVQFIVHNKTDFDTIYVPYFLKPNATIVLDYGWSDTNLYDINGVIDNVDTELKDFKKFIYGIPKEGPGRETAYVDGDGELKYKDGDDVIEMGYDRAGFVNENDGKVIVEIGSVFDFSSKLNNQGSYECSLTFINQGSSLLDATITEENGLKYLFTTQFEEVLIELLSYTYKSEESFTTDQFLQYDVLTANSKQEVRERFYKNLGLASSLTGAKETVGTLKLKNISSGIFYQDTNLVFGDAANQIDSGYISYGLFEDLFLNTLVLENLSEDQTHSVQYLSHDCFISYDENLLLRQKELPANKEGLSQFLYPPKSAETLREGYNSRTQFKSLNKSQTIKVYKDMLSGNHEGFTKPILPFRDLFISIKLITKAFETKQNINAALENIIEGLNKDSYDVFKLKMISVNKSYSSIGLTDLNLHKGYGKETLTFDITKNSIVSNIDFSYSTPKGDLANSIAVGGDDSLDFFDDDGKDKQKFLGLFGPDKEEYGLVEDVVRINLPVIKSKADNPNKKEKLSNRDFKYEKASKIIKKLNINPKNTDLKGNWASSINNLSLLKENNKKTNSGVEGTSSPKTSRPTGKILSDKRLKATSMKDYYGKLAKQFIFGSDEGDAPSLIPGELSLTIYGNSYLQIGDIININYLPKYIADKLHYIITGIEHKIDSKWETTYNTRMRILPTKKKNIIGKIEEPIFGKEVIGEEIKETSPVNGGFEDAIIAAKPVSIENTYVTSKLIESVYDKETFDTFKELSKTDTIMKQLGGTYVATEFPALSNDGWWEYFFLSALQTTMLDTWLKGGNKDKGTRIQLYDDLDKIPYTNPERLYSTAFIKNPAATVSKRPDIIMNVLVDRDDSVGIFAVGNSLNAAGNYLANIYTGRFSKKLAYNVGFAKGMLGTASIRTEDKNVVQSALETVAKRSPNKQFYDTYIDGISFNPGMINANPLTELKVMNANIWKNADASSGIRESKYGITTISFAFNMAHTASEEKVFSYLFDFKLPLLGSTYNRRIIIPKWFLDDAGVSPNDFTDSVWKLFNDEKLRKVTVTAQPTGDIG